MNAFIITLMDNPVRRLNAFWLQQQLYRLAGYNAQLSPALDYKDHKFRYVSVAEDAELTAGEIACCESHKRVYRTIIDQGQPAFVLEDDAYFHNPPHPDWFEGVEHIMTCGTYPNDDPLCPKIDYTDDGPNRFKTVGMPWGMHGYYITPEGAQLILDHSHPLRLAADVITNDLSRRGILKTYVAKDCCVRQHELINSAIGDR